MASLGPVSVKISQTLSQRPDIVGDEAATALKRLQTSNVPFADRLAWAVVKESLGWEGAIAPGVGEDEGRPKRLRIRAMAAPIPSSRGAALLEAPSSSTAALDVVD